MLTCYEITKIHIIKPVVSILGLILLYGNFSGCATIALHGANEEYNETNIKKNIRLSSIVYSSNVYQLDNTKYYEIPNQTLLLYVMANENGELSFVEEKPSLAKKIGLAQIIIKHKKDFNPNILKPATDSFPKEIYVVGEKTATRFRINDSYSIYYMTKSGMKIHGPIPNNLKPSTSDYLLSILIKGGYLISVPSDVITAPLTLPIFTYLLFTVRP